VGKCASRNDCLYFRAIDSQVSILIKFNGSHVCAIDCGEYYVISVRDNQELHLPEDFPECVDVKNGYKSKSFYFDVGEIDLYLESHANK